MAIVQISRIQNRRGRELTEIGIPQLAGGEIGWAIDTQKMYIGNGAVSEGAPAVGNTEILTQHSDIFALANSYIYKNTSNLWGSTAKIAQTLEAKLDATTTVIDFGAVGDGLGTDDAPAFQAAIDALYLRSLISKEKVTLKVPAGEYILRSTIYIPPLVSLVGDGVGKTILYTESDTTATASTKPMFAFANGNAQPGVYTGLAQTVPVTSSDTTQVRHNNISGMTLRNNRFSAVFQMREVARSNFSDLKIEGVWTFGGDFGDADESFHVVFDMIGTGNAQCIENTFTNIDCDNFYHIVEAPHDADKNVWTNINASICWQAFVMGVGSLNSANGFATGPSYNIIQDSKFDLVYRDTLLFENGNYNTSQNNTFLNCGNDGGDEGQCVTPVISFTNDMDNKTENDHFQRTLRLSPHRSAGDSSIIDPHIGTNYIADVAGRVNFDNKTRHSITIGNTQVDGGTDPVDILKLPLYNEGVVYLDYLYEGQRVNGVDADIYLRQTGTMEFHYDSNNTTLLVNQTTDFTGDTTYLANFVFSAVTDDIDGSLSPSIVVKCKNLTPLTEDLFTYSYRVRA
jgi:hypothetical protein